MRNVLFWALKSHTASHARRYHSFVFNKLEVTSGMKIGKGNSSARRTRVSVSRCTVQTHTTVTRVRSWAAALGGAGVLFSYESKRTKRNLEAVYKKELARSSSVVKAPLQAGRSRVRDPMRDPAERGPRDYSASNRN
jgi:hypothetical protein